MSATRRTRPVLLATALAVLLPCPSSAQTPDRSGSPTPPSPLPPAQAVVLPANTYARQKLEAARDYIKTQAWGEAVTVLQTILDAKDDQFLPASRPSRDGKLLVYSTGLRAEAERLLAGLPPAGREFYNAQYGPKASALLKDARAGEETTLLAEVVRRYLYTDAGAEAAERLAGHHLDRGGRAGAAYYGHLLARPGAELSPLSLFKAALAFRLAGDAAREGRAWKRLQERAPDGLRLGTRTLDFAGLRAEADRLARQRAFPASWSVFRGDAARDARGDADLPLLETLWTADTLGDKSPREWVENGVKGVERAGRPLLPGSFPIATPGRVVYRGHDGLHAADLATGRELWRRPSPLSLDAVARDAGKAVNVRNWLESYGGAAHFPLVNATVGTLSTDGLRVFAVEDLPLPPPPHLIQPPDGASRPSFGPLANAVFANRLRAVDLDTGELLWEKGGRGTGELNGGFFLGPPLPADGRLYALLERDGDVRLVALDPARGDVVWSLKLAGLRDRVLLDPARRLRGCHLTYADGLLICPTDGGAVLAVDPLTRGLAWAFLYPSKKPAPQEGTPPFNVSELDDAWRPSAPVVAEGRVLLTPGDADTVYCLDLRAGTPLWQAGRDGDLFFAGVQRGRVVLVGAGRTRALGLADGKQAWERPTGVPSGQGAAGDGVYYLPLKASTETGGPGVLALDMASGRALAFARARAGDVPGNLAFFGGEVVSQTVDGVTVYPNLKTRLARVDRLLAGRPRDPRGLVERGTLRRDQGNFDGALADLRAALAVNPPDEVRGEARRRLHEVLAQWVRRDFAAGEKHLDELWASCRVPGREGADEQRRREANTLAIVARGRASQGRFAEALALYGRLDGLTERVPGTWQGEELGWTDAATRRTTTATGVGPQGWLRGRVGALLDAVAPGGVAPILAEVRRQGEAARAGDLDALGRFVALYGTVPGVGPEARLEYAERLAASGRGRFLEAELHLLQARRQRDDPATAARATEALARLLTQAGEAEDALFYYRSLGEEFANTPLHDGMKGADYLRDLAFDKRFVGLLDDPWEKKRFRVVEVRGTFPPRGQFLGLDPEGEAPPLFRRQRLVLDVGAGQLKLIDRDGRAVLMEVDLSLGMLRPLLATSLQPHARVPISAEGHLAVVPLGHVVYGLDLLEKRVLWKHDLGDRPKMAPTQVGVDESGIVSVTYPTGRTVLLDGSGPVRPGCVCVPSTTDLVALDPLNGAVSWTRPLPEETGTLGGDDRYVYLGDFDPSGRLRDVRIVLRPQDGSRVELPAATRGGQLGGRSLARPIFEAVGVEGSPEAIRLRDSVTGKELWKVSLPEVSVLLSPREPHLAGFVTRGGTLRVFDLHDRREVLTGQIEAEHMQGVTAAELLRDRDHYYVLLNRQPKAGGGPSPGPTTGLAGGLRCLPADGTLYAFRRDGKRHWHNDGVRAQRLMLEHFEESPVILFTSSRARPDGNVTSSVVSIDKRTGKSLLLNKQLPPGTAPFHAVRLDPAEGTIDLVGHNLTIRHVARD